MLSSYLLVYIASYIANGSNKYTTPTSVKLFLAQNFANFSYELFYGPGILVFSNVGHWDR